MSEKIKISADGHNPFGLDFRKMTHMEEASAIPFSAQRQAGNPDLRAQAGVPREKKIPCWATILSGPRATAELGWKP